MSKYGNPIIKQDSDPNIQEEWNASQIAFLREITPTEPISLKDPDKTLALWSERLEKYLDACSKYAKKVGNLSCYMALGITKQQVEQIVNGTHASKLDPRLKDFIIRIKQFCGTYREALGQDGKINPATLIFWQKNFDGFRDQTEVITTNAPMIEEQNFKELESKYTKLIVTDATEVD